MKISPLAQGSGVPSADVGAASTGRTSPDRISRAKAIAAGEQSINVSVSENTDPQAERARADIRKIKMRTNVSPDRHFDEPEVAQATETQTSESAITDNSDSTQTANEETKPLSPQFAALAKQRRALQQEKAAFEKEKAEFQAQPKDGSATEFMSRLKQEPLRVLEEAGMLNDDSFYNALTESILNGHNPAAQEIRALKAEIEALKTGVDTKFTERDSQAKQQALGEMKRDAEKMVADGDTYEMVRLTGSVPKAIELIERIYDESGEVMDVTEALNLIEEELLNDQIKIAQANKVRSRLQPTQEHLQMQQQTGMRTLTNRDGARPVLSRRERAIQAALGQLKR